MRKAARASQRKLIIEPDAPLQVYWLVDRLREELDQLHPEQIKLIEGVLAMRQALQQPRSPGVRRIKNFSLCDS